MGGLESGPAGKAWVHTHWYEEQVPSKVEEKRSQIFGQPASGFRLHLHPARSSNKSRERRSEENQNLRRVRRSARFGGRSGLGLHWARDQEKMLLERLSQWMEKVRKGEERKLLELERQLEQELGLDNISREEVLTEDEQHENSEEDDQLSQEEEMVQGLRSLMDNFPDEDEKRRIHGDDVEVIDPKFGKRSSSSHLPWQLAQSESTETQDP